MAVENNKQSIIDAHFFVPKGVIDVRQENSEDAANAYQPGNIAQEGPTLNLPEATIPMPPTSYEIVDQHVRVSADGTTVVDVTLEFPDIQGIYSIDVRITKA